MPVVFKTTKIAQRAQSDPLLYEMLRDFGNSWAQFTESVCSGSYVPALTNVLNVAYVSPHGVYYSRVFDTVHVHGSLALELTAGSAITKVGISLPFASKLKNPGDLSGHGNRWTGGAVLYGRISEDIANARAEWVFASDATTYAKDCYFTFSYVVK